MDIDQIDTLFGNANANLDEVEKPTVFTCAVALTTSGSDIPLVSYGEPEMSVSRRLERTQCNTCGKLGHTAGDCPNPHQERICGNCHLRGHKASKCTKGTFCKNCGSEKHTLQKCDVPMNCQNCGKNDHVTFDCEEVPKNILVEHSDLKPEQEKVNVNFLLYHQNEHVMHCTVRLKIFFRENPEAEEIISRKRELCFWNGTMHKKIIIMKEITEKMALRDEHLQFLANRFGKSTETITLWCEDNDMVHVMLPYKLGDDGKGAVGFNFFTNEPCGSFTQNLEHAQTFFLTPREDFVYVHLLIRRNDTLLNALKTWNDAYLKEQAAGGPMANWKFSMAPEKLILQKGQCRKLQDRPKYSIPAKTSYFSTDEYLLSNFYHVIEKMEAHEVLQRSHLVLARFYPLPGSNKTEWYVWFQRTADGPRLAEGDRFQLCLDYVNDERPRYWSGTVLRPTGVETADFYVARVRRAWLKEKTVDGIKIPARWDDLEPKSCSIIAPKDPALKVMNNFRQLLVECVPTEVEIHIELPDDDLRRQYNVIKFSAFPFFPQEEVKTLPIGEKEARMAAAIERVEPLLAGNVRRATPIDVFASLRSHPSFETVFNNILDGLNEEQKVVWRGMQRHQHPFIILQGVPGAGKTRILKDLIKIFYLCAPVVDGIKQPAKVVALAENNNFCDSLAMSMHDLLKAAWMNDPEHNKYPVVVRFYSPKLEKELIKLDSKLKRQYMIEPSPNKRPEYLKVHDPPDLSDFPVAEQLLDIYLDARKQAVNGVSDRRVKPELVHLGRSTIIQQLLGMIKTEDGIDHPLMPRDGRFSKVSDFLRKYASGADLEKEEFTSYAEALEPVIDYFNSITDVQCCTASVYAEFSVNQAFVPNLTFLDEASRCTELDSIAPWLLTDISFYILSGDINQMRPQSSFELNKIAFGRQAYLSLMGRLMAAGVPFFELLTQMRYPESICQMMVSLGVKNLKTHADVMKNEEVLAAQRFIEQRFGIKNVNHVFIDMPSGKSTRFKNSTSKVNYKNILFVLFLWASLIEHGVQPEDVGIFPPYVAQKDQYLVAMVNLLNSARENGITQFQPSTISKIITTIETRQHGVFTWNSSQGQEFDHVIADCVSSDKHGMLKDHGQLHVIITRCRLSLFIIGNIDGWAGANRYRPSNKVYRLVEHVKGTRGDSFEQARASQVFTLTDTLAPNMTLKVQVGAEISWDDATRRLLDDPNRLVRVFEPAETYIAQESEEPQVSEELQQDEPSWGDANSGDANPDDEVSSEPAEYDFKADMAGLSMEQKKAAYLSGVEYSTKHGIPLTALNLPHISPHIRVLMDIDNTSTSSAEKGKSPVPPQNQEPAPSIPEQKDIDAAIARSLNATTEEEQCKLKYAMELSMQTFEAESNGTAAAGPSTDSFGLGKLSLDHSGLPKLPLSFGKPSSPPPFLKKGYFDPSRNIKWHRKPDFFAFGALGKSPKEIPLPVSPAGSVNGEPSNEVAAVSGDADSEYFAVPSPITTPSEQAEDPFEFA